jgi:predicted RNase H-like nuclease (RuvC/YqgF family)
VERKKIMEWLLIPLFLAAAVFCGLWRHAVAEANGSYLQLASLRKSSRDTADRAESLAHQNEKLSADNARQAKQIDALAAELASLKAKPARKRSRTQKS